MSQRTAGTDWTIYTADTGTVLTADQVEKNKAAIWWLSGVARGDVCALLENDLRSCAGRVDLLVLVLEDVRDISSECLQMLVRLQKEVLDIRNGELRLANAKGAVAEKLSRLRIQMVLNVTQEKLDQPQTGRPAVEISAPKPVTHVVPTDYACVEKNDKPALVPEVNEKPVDANRTVYSSAPKKTAWLLIDRRDGTVYRGKMEETVVGRLTECDICLPMPSISRRHLKIYHSDNQWWIQDLGSSFGTRLNDHPLEQDKPVALARNTAVLQMSRFCYDLVLAPYCGLVETQENASGPVAHLVHEASGEFLCMLGNVMPLGRDFAPEDSRVMQAKVISHRHAEIRREADGWYLVDMNSTNGTYLDDNLLSPEKPVKLTDGARIRMGSMERGERFLWAEGRGADPDEM